MSEYDGDLKPQVQRISDPKELVRIMWESSTKNVAAQGYIVGMIDALRWSMSITKDQYIDLYESFVHTERADRTE